MNNFAKVSEGGHLSLGEEHTCLKFMLENALGQGQMLIVTVLSCLRVCVCVCVCVCMCAHSVMGRKFHLQPLLAVLILCRETSGRLE